MDPSIFFGRTRQTRQTLKSKQETAIKENENIEVNNYVPKEMVKRPVGARKPKAVTEGKENSAFKETAALRTSRRVVKPVKKSEDAPKGVKGKRNPCNKSLKVLSDGQKDDGISEEGSKNGGTIEEAAPTGPVYRNVCRSDVAGDPNNEYEFSFSSDSSSEKVKKTKKKTTRKKQPTKKTEGVVKWDPSKRPIVLKTKPSKKVLAQTIDTSVKNINQAVKLKLPSNQPSKVACSSKKIIESTVTANRPIPSNSEQLSGAISKVVCSSKKDVESEVTSNCRLLSNSKLLSGTSTPEFTGAQHVSSTPVLRQSSRKILSVAAQSNTSGNRSIESLAAVPDGKGQELPVQSNSLSYAPLSPSMSADIQCASTSTAETPNCVSLNAQTGLKSQPAQVSSRRNYSLPFRQLCIRESPSFREENQLPESPQGSSPGLFGSDQARKLDAITSTPVTRSRKNNTEAVKTSNIVNINEPLSSNSKVTCSPVRTENSVQTENYSCGNLSGIFDDIPRTSVLPTRMFSTHRGTIYIPEGQNVPKRKMPQLSPSKEESSSRVTLVKFPALPASSDVDQCFGFDEMDENITFVPQPTAKNVKNASIRRSPVKKPNLTIKEAQAILRGQCKLASPANITPRSIQTKLTDFVSSTPTSTPARVVPVSNPNVLTPTVVPLFGVDELEKDLPSPFSQPSRRSYDRFRPVKRVAYGDEVHSGDDEDAAEQHDTESSIPVKKKNKSYKRTKKPKETPLDAWANQLASHFDEVEEVQLEME